MKPSDSSRWSRMAIACFRGIGALSVSLGMAIASLPTNAAPLEKYPQIKGGKWTREMDCTD